MNQLNRGRPCSYLELVDEQPLILIIFQPRSPKLPRADIEKSQVLPVHQSFHVVAIRIIRDSRGAGLPETAVRQIQNPKIINRFPFGIQVIVERPVNFVQAARLRDLISIGKVHLAFHRIADRRLRMADEAEIYNPGRYLLLLLLRLHIGPIFIAIAEEIAFSMVAGPEYFLLFPLAFDIQGQNNLDWLDVQLQMIRLMMPVLMLKLVGLGMLGILFNEPLLMLLRDIGLLVLDYLKQKVQFLRGKIVLLALSVRASLADVILFVF